MRNLHRHDPLFWDDWFARSGLDALVRDHLRKPRLLRHAAFIKRHADESYIPLHQTSRYGRSATKARRPSGSP